MANLKNIQTEIDSSYLYGILASQEKDKEVAAIFLQMSEIERGHAVAFLAKSQMDTSRLPPPSTRARILNSISKLFGYDYILGVLLDIENDEAFSLKSGIAIGLNFD